MATPYDPAVGTSEAFPEVVEANRRNRLKQIFQSWQNFPGRVPGGTGLTGLNRNDSRGWSQVLQDQIDAQGLMSDEPVEVRTAPLSLRGFGEANGLKQQHRRRMLAASDATRPVEY